MTSATIPSARIRRFGAACVLGASLLMAGGCASVPTVTSDLTRFHRWENAEPRTIAFRTDPRRAGSLEYASYEARLGRKLLELGFTLDTVGQARYEVSLEFSASPEPRRIIDAWGPGLYGPYPLWGVPGFTARRRFDPWWGIPPAPIVTDLTVWRHDVRVDVWDVRVGPAGGRKVFEASASAVAETEALPRLVPALVDALLEGFPGASGITQRVEVPLAPRPD